MKRLLAGIGVLLALGVVTPRADAQNVVSSLFYNQLNRISDNSGDFLFNRFGGNTTLDVGDILITTFQIDNVEDLTGGGGTRSFLSPPRNEFTGFSAIEVTSITGSPGAFVINFAPVSAAGRAAVAANGTMPGLSGLLSGMNADSMILLMDDGALHNYTRTFNGTFPGPDDVPVGPNPPGDIGIGPFAQEDLLGTTIHDVGATITEFGFTGTGFFWNSTAPSLDVAAVAVLPTSGNFGAVNFGLNVTANPAGIQYGVVSALNPITLTLSLVNFGGNANLQGVGLGTPDFASTPYDAFDDFNANFRPLQIAPEPASLALIAIGSLGFGGLLRRRIRSAS